MENKVLKAALKKMNSEEKDNLIRGIMDVKVKTISEKVYKDEIRAGRGKPEMATVTQDLEEISIDGIQSLVRMMGIEGKEVVEKNGIIFNVHIVPDLEIPDKKNLLIFCNYLERDLQAFTNYDRLNTTLGMNMRFDEVVRL